MINLYEKGRIPSQQKEIMTKSFLIDKIANDMRSKYKKVFSFINYDELTLKNDINCLLAKYISNNKKEINIKYIETTLLNKVREKYRRRSPFKTIKKNKSKNNNLIKVINPSSKRNIYLRNEESKEIKNQLPVIENKNKDFALPIIHNNYLKTVGETDKNEDEKIYDIDKKLDDLEKEEKTMKEEIDKEKEEIRLLEQYKKNIQRQIDIINKEIEKENAKIQEEILNKKANENINLNNNDNNIDISNNIEKNNINDYDLNNNLDNKEELNEELIWAYNPLMSFDQMKYLDRKKKIEEDVFNKENKYKFLKPKINHENNIHSKSIEMNNRRPFNINKIKMNNYTMDNTKKIHLKNKNQETKKEDNNRYLNIPNPITFSFADFANSKQNKLENSEPKKRALPHQDSVQLKVLQRSLAQEKAYNNLRKILSPENELLNESNYQGFNNNKHEDYYERKRKEYELADKARQIQIEKMKKFLNASIIEKENRRKAEKEFDKKYRELNEKEDEDYMERENQKKLKKQETMRNYRKMLEEQIEQKKKLMLKDELYPSFNLDNMF